MGCWISLKISGQVHFIMHLWMVNSFHCSCLLLLSCIQIGTVSKFNYEVFTVFWSSSWLYWLIFHSRTAFKVLKRLFTVCTNLSPNYLLSPNSINVVLCHFLVFSLLNSNQLLNTCFFFLSLVFRDLYLIFYVTGPQ